LSHCIEQFNGIHENQLTKNIFILSRADDQVRGFRMKLKLGGESEVENWKYYF
jgi:hypothetical protein